MNPELLRVEDLSVSFPSANGKSRNTVVDRVFFSIYENEFLGLVGESGSGKSVTALSIMRLLRPPGRIEGGKVWYQGENLLEKSERELQTIRGAQLALIFQSLSSFLNPLKRVGDQIARAYSLGRNVESRKVKSEVATMLRKVGISDVDRVMKSYPHQLSGGMCQRVMTAMTISRQPDLLIADEPTTGLDVTIQAQIFELMKNISERMAMSVLLITHDLGVVAETCDRVVVMRAGHVVEIGSAQDIFREAGHPYTHRLLGSVLRADRVISLPDLPPPASEEITYSASGCRYVEQCEKVMDVCHRARPAMTEVAPGHWVMCHLYE